MKIKNNLIVMILSSVVCLLPLILSLAVYSDLPEQIAVQWSNTRNPTNVLPKAFAAFGLPLILMAVNIFSKLRLNNDPKRGGTPTVMRTIYLWLIPVISLLLVPAALFIAMDVNIPIAIIAPVAIGIVFILSGNYLPKSRQNYVIGIRLPWTLHDADNWNKTHRIAGYLRILGGMALITGSFITFGNLAWIVFSLAVLALVIIIPFLYSYSLYKKTGNNEQDNYE